MTLLTTLIGTLLFAVAGPVVGCLLAGLDRIISARMQGRVGPPLLQPYYDVRKLFEKERVSVNSVEGVYVACALLFALIAGGIFYSGGKGGRSTAERHGQRQQQNSKTFHFTSSPLSAF